MKSYDLTDGLKIARERLTSRPSDEGERVIQAALAIDMQLEMSEEELTAAKNLIESAQSELARMCSSIQSQIDEANLRRDQDGEMSDPDWYRRVHGAMRAKRWQRQQLQNKVGEVNRKLRTARHGVTMASEQGRERLFIHVAKLHLPAETYDRLWALVDETERVRT